MKFQEQIFINAPSSIIFQKYADVANWYVWDREVKESIIEGNFETGSYGLLIPTRGPKAKIYFSSVIPDCAFTVLSKLPLCTMLFEHELYTLQNKTQVTHTVSFEGPLRFVFGYLIGRQIKASLPETLKGLKRTVEK